MSRKLDRIDHFEVEYEFLSNMFVVEPNGIAIVEKNRRIRLPTSEHIYASSKLQLDGDRAYVRNAPSGRKARDRARHLVEIGQPATYTDDNGRIDLMRHAIEAKFFAGSLMASLLLATENALLVEGNNWDDNFWGSSPPDNLDGLNNLGIILMDRRQDLQQQ